MPLSQKIGFRCRGDASFILSTVSFYMSFWIDLSFEFLVFWIIFDHKSKKNRNEKRLKKTSIFQSIFSSILVDFGLHFGTPEFRDSLVWATMAALGSCLALSWVILRALIRFLPPLGSIVDRFLIESGLHFLILGTIFQ